MIVDVETTGTSLDHDRIYEIAIIAVAEGRPPRVYHVSLPVTSSDFHDEIPRRMWEAHRSSLPPPTDPPRAAREIARLTAGAVIVGNNPAFDAARLGAFLIAHGQSPSWHYQLDDVEARAAERLGAGPPPWNSAELSKGLGVDRSQYDAHSALGDARWTLAQYEVLTGKDFGSSLLGRCGLAPSGRSLA